jgi:hypothetical protein
MALALALVALPLLAAPVPKKEQAPAIDKYLPDDTDGVLVVNVKQILDSPAYKKSFQKQLGDLIARDEVQKYLKDCGFDPLKDIERVVVCISKSCFAKEGGSGEDRDDGPFILFQGKFDSAKVKAKMAAIAKDHPEVITSSEAPGGQTIYRIDRRGPYATLLDSSTVVIAGKKSHVLDALLKASGKKTTKLLYKELSAHLKKLKTDVSVQGIALEQMVMTSTYERVNDGGKGRFERRNIRLVDKGYKEALLSITVKDDARGSLTWQIKDPDKSKALNAELTAGLTQIRTEGQREAARRPEMAPLVRFFEGVTIKSKGNSIVMEGKADVEMVQALINNIWRL